MINVIQTLKNLNKEFPRFQLETLLKIVECIQDDVYTPYKDWTTEPTIRYNVVCEDNPFIYNTTTKNHAADKTSSHQNITSEGELATNEDMNFSSTIKDLSDLQRVLKATYGVGIND